MMSVFLTTYQGAILGPIARLLGYILQGLYSVLSVVGIENTGICMILFTFIVNALMIPMQIKQQKFAKMSSVMNPELMAIQAKYKNKKDQESQQKMSLETQAVYQKYGVSPVSGCLPMLITLPILFALYRVIYNIPAYVPQVYDIYDGLAKVLQEAGVTVSQLADKSYISNPTYVVTQAVKAAKSDAGNINYYIDVLSQFNSSGWDVLIKNHPDLSEVITKTAHQARDINYFLGLNIADTPKIKSVSVIIPIFSIVTQYISTKLSMAGTQQQTANSDNPMGQSMQTMNTVMPFMTGFMCLMFPIGVGIYWIAGNVFRIFQQLCINLYFSKINMDDLIKENVDKAKKKYEKMGMDPSVLDKAAKTRTSNINTNAAQKQTSKADNAAKKNSSISDKARKSSTKDIKKSKNSNYKEGSIAAYANMLNRDDK
ncbi:membrane protein insertase YidC [Clostridium sp. OM07-10AC]|mgnify:FL=1|nr:membrane protein insertase YidC [Clostridium sp. OM07-9AC]RHV00201.1 membrane protein insertase YidC [Clostridium sp. OM07-10AC]